MIAIVFNKHNKHNPHAQEIKKRKEKKKTATDLAVSIITMKICRWNYTEKFDALKFTLKNNIKEDSTENHTETIPLLFRNA